MQKMKCLVFSDSHGDTALIYRAIREHPDAEVVFFLGDGLSDIERVAGNHSELAFIAVVGNCDSYKYLRGIEVGRLEEITLLGNKILLTHGDAYGVKASDDRLIYLAEERLPDILIHGHTHIKRLRYVSLDIGHGFYLFNPGTARGYGASYGVITLYEGAPPLISYT